MLGRKRTAAVLAVAVLCLGIAFLQSRRANPREPAGSPTATTGYMDADVCAECHPAIAKTYALTGMARSFGAFRPDTPAPMFPEGEFRHDASRQFFTMSRREAQPYLKRHLIDSHGQPSEQREAQIHYWIGSGNQGRGFATRASSGKLRLLPVTWYAENGGHWGMNPGYERPNHAGFERIIDYRCMSCHAGYPEIEPGADRLPTGWEYPGKLVEGIDCQRCHGPGQRHVEAIRRGQGSEAARSAIVNPARLSPERRIEVCMQCHLETTSVQLPSEIVRFDRGVFSYRPGEPLADWILSFDYPKGAGHDDRFEFVSSVYRLLQSACFRESGGKLTCTTCHNPHDIPRGEAAVRHYSSVCRQCHDVKTMSHATVTECISCHMPKRTPSDAPRIRISDHIIRKRPQPDPEPATPYRGEVVHYYPRDLPKTPEDELYEAVAQVTQQTNLERGVVRLEKLVKRHRPEHGEFYLQLGNAWRNRGRLEKSREWLEEAVRRMPDNWRPIVLLGNTLAAMRETDRAIELLRRAVALAPREAAPRHRLGEVYMSLGKPAEAIAAFQAAIRIDPEFAEAHNSLGSAYMMLSDAASSEKTLREAVRLRPEWPQARANLASLLAVVGDFAEAKHHFELALRIDPSFASAHSAYGTALAQRGSLAPAKPHYEQALRLNPADAVTHQNLGGVLRQLGEMDSAIREYQAAIRYDANSYEAHLALGEIYIARRQRAAAEPHLRKASASPDPEVRGQATTLLGNTNK